MNIGNGEYKEILVTDEDGELITSITDENVVVKEGYSVECVPTGD